VRRRFEADQDSNAVAKSLAAPSSSKQSRLRLRRQAVPDDADDSEIPRRYFSGTPLGHLNNFIRFSAVDGPGNRFVLFLQGCNFDCIGCHNPYTISTCNDCGVCVGPCPEAALHLEGGRVRANRHLCTDCDVCIEVCPENSTPLAAYVSVEEIVAEIRQVAPFISGVTVSGGEATMQPEFVAALFTEIKTDPELRRLTTFVDSNGSAPRRVWDLLLPVMDAAMIDLKAFDPSTHFALTGVDNEAVLESIVYLAERRRLYEVRLLVMPGHNDETATIDMTVDWLRSVDPAMRVKIIGFRHHGVRPAGLSVREPDSTETIAIGDRFRAAGFADVVVV